MWGVQRKDQEGADFSVPPIVPGAELALEEAATGSEELRLWALASAKPNRVPLPPPSLLLCLASRRFPHIPLHVSFLGLFIVSTAP